MGRAPGAGTWQALEQRVVEAVRDMVPLEDSNLMWAYATLGRSPGAALCEVLERRAGNLFNAQQV